MRKIVETKVQRVIPAVVGERWGFRAKIAWIPAVNAVNVVESLTFWEIYWRPDGRVGRVFGY